MTPMLKTAVLGAGLALMLALDAVPLGLLSGQLVPQAHAIVGVQRRSFATGMIVGESLFGVLSAGLIVALSNDAPIALVPADFGSANVIGIAGFCALIALLYGWMLRRTGART